MWYMCTSDIRWQSASEVPPQMFVTMLAKKSPKGHHEKHVPKNYYFKFNRKNVVQVGNKTLLMSVFGVQGKLRVSSTLQ